VLYVAPMLILASASSRRRELLERIGVPIEVRPANVDESLLPGEAPLDYVRRVAAAKADAVAGAADADGGPAGHRTQTAADAAGDERWVLAADTIVEIDGDILGKAADDAEATAMLRRLRGRSHRVTTAVALRGPGVAADRMVSSDVLMIDASDDLIAEYVASGEWQGKAGAYAVQGIGAALVVAVHGSITNVIGLPLAEVVDLLRDTGAPPPRFRKGKPA